MSKPFTASDDVVPGETYQAGYREGYENALAEQPFDRAAIIEECVQIIEQWETDDAPRSYLDLIAAIRALKGKP